jgi:peptide/nickel transport system permease protein
MHSADFILRRVGLALLTICFVAVLNFFLFRVLPGDPSRVVRDPRMTREAQEAIQRRFGLDKPLLIGAAGNPFDSQFFRYLGNLTRGDLGISFNFNRPVADMLRERLANTVLLVLTGELLAIAIGIALGVAAAYRRGGGVDIAALLFGLFTWALPTFFLGIILLILGSTLFGLPVGGLRTPGASYAGWWERAADTGRHMLLPTLTLTIVLLGQYMLVMRSSLLEVLGEDYIFSWPGLGSAVFEAVGRRDYPMLQGAFLLFSVSVILANTAADLLYAVLDPRVRS